MAGYPPSTEERTISTWARMPQSLKGPPVRGSDEIEVEAFGPSKKSGSWTFNRGIQFSTPPAGTNSDILAVANGVLTFIPAIGSEPAAVSLQLSGLDESCMRAIGKPAWVTELKYLLYRGVDPARVQAAVEKLLATPSRLTTVNRNYQESGHATATAAVLAQTFVQSPEDLAAGIPVTVGEVVGAGALVGARRTFGLEVRDPFTMAPLSRNPSWYFSFWELAGLLDLASHPLAARILKADACFEASGVLRFVEKTGNDTNVPFFDASLPAQTVGAAIAAASDGDTILILDSGTYSEPELIIDKAINITSAAELSAEQRHLGSTPNAVTPPDVPVTLPELVGNGTNFKNIDKGPSDASFFPNATTHRVLRFVVPAGRGIASLTKVAVRYGGAREGGGVLLYQCNTVLISSCVIERNVAYYNQTAGYPKPFPGSGWASEGFGGGICCLYGSSPIIWGNCIRSNLASSGGGIGLFSRCFPLIVLNYVAKNRLPDWFGTVTKGDGGGIRALSVTLRAMTWELSKLDVTDISQKAQLHKAFYDTYGLIIEAEEMYEVGDINECQRSWIRLHRNCILENRACDDGGGVYGTGISRCMCSQNLIASNVAARGDGGGYRVSTASVLRSVRDSIANNRTDGPIAESAAGGGIASRCSDLYLMGTRIESNRSHFAGAGIAFTVNREGGVTGVSWLPGTVPPWDDMRRLAFHYDHAFLQIDSTSQIASNVADDSGKGKGGGIYVFRQYDPGTSSSSPGQFVSDKLTLGIENASIVLDGSNDSAFIENGVKPYRRLYLLDQVPEASGSATVRLGDSALVSANLDYLST